MALEKKKMKKRRCSLFFYSIFVTYVSLCAVYSILYLYVKAGRLEIFADKGIKSKGLKIIIPEGKNTMTLA